MVRVIHKRIIAFLLCVALTFGAVSATKPTEAKAFVLDFLSAEALQALIAALQAAAGQAMDAATDIATSSDALADTSNMLIAAENFVYYIMANRIIPLVDDAGQRFAGYVTSNFVFENSVSYDNVDDYFRAMDPSKTQEVINDPEFICAVPYDPSQLYYLSPAVVENTQSKLKERGTSLMEIMQRLRDCGVTTYQSFVSALKDILKDTATVLVNDQTKAMFNAILQVTSNAVREVARANGGTGTNEMCVTQEMYDEFVSSGYMDFIKLAYDKQVNSPDYRYINTIACFEGYKDEKESNWIVYDNSPSQKIKYLGFYNDYLTWSENGSRCFDIIGKYKDGNMYSGGCWSEGLPKIYLKYVFSFTPEIVTFDDALLDYQFVPGTYEYPFDMDGNIKEKFLPSAGVPVYKGLPDVSVLENAGSLDALVEQAKTKDDPVAWINPNAQVADADADAAEAEALASQMTLINQGIDKSNSWLESIFNSIRGMATTVTNIFDVLSTGLSKMLTGAADRVVEGFQDIFIDDVGDNVLERTCDGVENLVAGVGDLADLKTSVIAIEEAVTEQAQALTVTSVMSTELTMQLRGFDIKSFFNLIYLIILILIELLLLFLRCFALIVTVFQVPADPGFLPDGMVKGIDWLKGKESVDGIQGIKIANFNISIWDFMFLLIYIILVFRIVGNIKRHIDEME